MTEIKDGVTIYIEPKAKEFLEELGQPWRYAVDRPLACLTPRKDAPALMSLLKEANFKVKY